MGAQGREVRDVLIGKLFGFAAISRMIHIQAQHTGAMPSAASVARLVQDIMFLSQGKGAACALDLRKRSESGD